MSSRDPIEKGDRRCWRSAATGVTAVLVCGLLLATLAGCAESGALSASGKTTAVPVDCSESVRGEQAAWDRQIAAIAAEVLAREETLLVGCFVGRVTGVKWLPGFRGGMLPAMTGGASARHRAEVAWGLSLEPLFRRALAVQSIPGTDWLSALRASSEIRGLSQVYLFSDLIQQAEGIELTTVLSERKLSQIAQEWAPRLGGLRDKTVVEVGGGEKVGGDRPDTQGVKLLEMLASLAGFRLEQLSTMS